MTPQFKIEEVKVEEGIITPMFDTGVNLDLTPMI